jgi:NAD(P)-dependent dehydrogenase (short-subunit alcohol dehydrogenase family)
MTGKLPGPNTHGQPLDGQTVVVIGGTSGIGLETARRARTEGASVILTGRNPQRLQQAASDVDAASTYAFDATDVPSLLRFFQSLPSAVDHVMVTAGGSYYSPIADMDLSEVRRAIDEHLLLTLSVAQAAVGRVNAGGTLIFMTGTDARRPQVGSSIAGVFAAALPALVANLALELAPIRVNLIAAGFVNTPLSASLLGDQLEQRREELRSTLPIRRVVEPSDVGSLAVHLMTNTALTGSTFDIDGGQKLVPVAD